MRYFVRLAEEAYPHLEGPEQGVWLDRVDPEHDNIRAALAHARNLGDREIELRLAVAVAPFRLKRGYLSEALLSLEEVLYVPGHSELRAIAFHHAGWAASFQGRSVDAEMFLGEGLALARELGDSQLIARQLLTSLGSSRIGTRKRRKRSTTSCSNSSRRMRRSGFRVHFSTSLTLRSVAASTRVHGISALKASPFRARREIRGVLHSRFRTMDWLCSAFAWLRRHLRTFGRLCGLWKASRDPHAIATMLSLVAAAMAERGEADRAVRLLAIAELMLEEMMLELPGLEADIHEHTVARMRAECSEFESEWFRGRSLTREEAIAEALSDGR